MDSMARKNPQPNKIKSLRPLNPNPPQGEGGHPVAPLADSSRLPASVSCQSSFERLFPGCAIENLRLYAFRNPLYSSISFHAKKAPTVS